MMQRARPILRHSIAARSEKALARTIYEENDRASVASHIFNFRCAEVRVEELSSDLRNSRNSVLSHTLELWRKRSRFVIKSFSAVQPELSTLPLVYRRCM
ncbi:hypothetical protein BC937DRAFT_90439 [Endogone sp. FLAS-F59071]|nr:hypothetical protein BC937DRAFT_90439 [Endogone sp. FLAS-F59071]|eukprot:RUS17087.1 hypothetical protein BC937DRAFT_90439 [Endogone sp. FLAS-F59071]